ALQGEAFVEDVVDQQHAAAEQRGGRAVLPHQVAAGFAVVTGGVQVVELQVLAACAQFQRKLAGERQRAVHDRQIDRDFTLVIARDRVGDAGNGLVDGGAVDQQVGLG